MGDLNFQFDQPSNTCTSKRPYLIGTFGLSQSVTTATHQHGRILDWVLHGPDDHDLQSTSVDFTLTADHYCIVSQLFLARTSEAESNVQHLNKAKLFFIDVLQHLFVILDAQMLDL